MSALSQIPSSLAHFREWPSLLLILSADDHGSLGGAWGRPLLGRAAGGGAGGVFVGAHDVEAAHLPAAINAAEGAAVSRPA